MIWQRGGTTRRRDDQDEKPSSSAEGIGWLLRAAREERGLDLLAVHDRLSRPITQLEALENGDLASLPDQALALSTLRRYAAFLGLDGDALALQMIDAWSAAAAPAPALSSAGAKRTQVGAGAVTNVVTAVTTGPDHLRAFTQTGEVPRVGAGSAAGGSGAYGYGVAPGPPTGTFPVVPRQEIRHSKRAVAKARRRLRAPTSLKVVTWVAVVLVLAVVAGFAIQQWRPQWLAQSHILQSGRPRQPATGSGGPGSGGTRGRGTPAPARGRRGHRRSPGPATPRRAPPTRSTPRLHRRHRHLGQVLGAGDQLGVAGAAGQSGPTGRQGPEFPGQGDHDRPGGASAVVVGVNDQREGRLRQLAPRPRPSPTPSPRLPAPELGGCGRTAR